MLILIISGCLSYLSIAGLLQSQKWVRHTLEVEAVLESLISRMKDAETSQRGFLLTGEESFLEPYKGARADVSSYLHQAELLTRDNAIQQQEFPLLEGLVNEKFKMIESSISIKRKGGQLSAPALLEGKGVMDGIRLRVKTMVSREKELLRVRNQEMGSYALYTPMVIAVAALLAMAVTISFYLRIKADAKAARLLEEELRRQDEETQRHLGIVNLMAERIVAGDYHSRIDPDELRK